MGNTCIEKDLEKDLEPCLPVSLSRLIGSSASICFVLQKGEAFSVAMKGGIIPAPWWMGAAGGASGHFRSEPRPLGFFDPAGGARFGTKQNADPADRGRPDPNRAQ